MKKFSFVYKHQGFDTREAFKSLRTNLMFCGEDIKVISVTSCLPKDGKSTISTNIALSFAEAGKKVLFIDADLRRSTIFSRVNVDEDVLGLSHLLTGQAGVNDVLYQSEYENLFAVFAGSFPPNPVELLGQSRFTEFIKLMRENFDYIIIDTPPLGSVIDSAIISTICDGCVMVVRSGRVSYKLAKKVKNQLLKSNCKILGVVLNDVNNNNSAYYTRYVDEKSYKSN